MFRKLVLGLFCLLPVMAFAQTDEEFFEVFNNRFNFATPGARATAMGRAFIALADDATAAYSNPAGLVLLTKPEISFEFKSTRASVERAALIDSLVSKQTTDFGQTVNQPSFLSFVYPKGRFRIALFRQEFLNYQENFELEGRNIPGTEIRFFPANGNVDFLGTNIGAAVAYRFSSKLFAGFSAKVAKLEAKTDVARFSGCITPGDSSCNVVNATVIDDSPSEFGFTGGILLNPSLKFSIGVIYEYNPKFDYQESFTGLGGVRRDFPVTIDVPDRFGAGIAVRPTDTLILQADFVWIEYSDLVKDFTVIIADGSQEVTADSFDIDNGVEFHAGVEKLFSFGRSLIAFRGGFLTIPPNDLRYVGNINTLDGITADQLFNFSQTDTDVGFTFGGGVVIGDHFQIDAAYLISDPFDEFSLSTVFRF